MLKLSKLGAIIIPPMPGFYYSPQKAGDLLDHVIGKVLDNLGIQNNLYKRWNENNHTKEG